MPTGKEIPNMFHVPQDEVVCTIEILMHSKEHDIMQYLMNTIDFAIPPQECPYVFEALPSDKNTTSLSRKIFVKKKK